jgi:hypothetical protein
METRVGRIVYVARSYTVAEIVEAQPGGVAIGYSVFGRGADTTRIYSKEAAMAALQALIKAADDQAFPTE